MEGEKNRREKSNQTTKKETSIKQAHSFTKLPKEGKTKKRNKKRRRRRATACLGEKGSHKQLLMFEAQFLLQGNGLRPINLCSARHAIM